MRRGAAREAQLTTRRLADERCQRPDRDGGSGAQAWGLPGGVGELCESGRRERRASVATPPAGKAGGPDPATGPATGNASPSVPGGASAAARPAQRAARGMGELMALLLEESDAPAVLMAMSGALEPSAHTPETLTLLGELALAAYDAQRAQEYAEQALQHDPGDAAALRVLARAYVVHGDASQALATARKAKAGDSTRGGFELEHLRTAGAPAAEVDRRLALLAFASGDLKEARQRFMELLSSGQGTDT